MEQEPERNDSERRIHESRIRLEKGEFNSICDSEKKKTLRSIYREWLERLIESY